MLFARHVATPTFEANMYALPCHWHWCSHACDKSDIAIDEKNEPSNDPATRSMFKHAYFSWKKHFAFTAKKKKTAARKKFTWQFYLRFFLNAVFFFFFFLFVFIFLFFFVCGNFTFILFHSVVVPFEPIWCHAPSISFWLQRIVGVGGVIVFVDDIDVVLLLAHHHHHRHHDHRRAQTIFVCIRYYLYTQTECVSMQNFMYQYYVSRKTIEGEYDLMYIFTRCSMH